MCSRCKACDSILSVYDLTVKRTVKLEDGSSMEVFEDLCGRCRSTLKEEQGYPEGIGDIIEVED